MLLRRIVQHFKDQNWFAVGIDFVIVVVGVFFGLQVQEWSAARAERSAEYAAIGRLIDEYQQNLELLSENKEKSQTTLAATERLLVMISPDPDPVTIDKTFAQTLLDCLTNPRFIPAVGTANSLVASGDLSLIDDLELQRLLNQWPIEAQNLIEWQEIERVHGEELILGVTFDYLAWPDIDRVIGDHERASALESDFHGLFSSKRFEGLLHNRWYNTGASIGRIEELELYTHQLIDRLQSRLEALEATRLFQ